MEISFFRSRSCIMKHQLRFYVREIWGIFGEIFVGSKRIFWSEWIKEIFEYQIYKFIVTTNSPNHILRPQHFPFKPTQKNYITKICMKNNETWNLWMCIFDAIANCCFWSFSDSVTTFVLLLLLLLLAVVVSCISYREMKITLQKYVNFLHIYTFNFLRYMKFDAVFGEIFALGELTFR